MRKLKKTISVLIFVIVVFVELPMNIMAEGEGVCGLLPCDQYDQDQITNINQTVEDLLKYGLSAIFVGILILGVYQIVKAVLKIIRSEGKQEDLEGGYNILKGVWVGIGLFFVGVIGLVIVLAVLDSGGIVSTDVNNPPGVDLPFID
jgi:hypothetical protein